MMNILLLAHPRLKTPLRALLRCFTSQPLAERQCAVPTHAAVAIDSIARQALVENAARRRRPLRVVRIMDSGQPAAQAGRIVISGCMADVCAELDRLVACEAAYR